jgi:putative addiction module killer protein
VRWLESLRDVAGRARIAKRIDRLAQGNFGDRKPVGDGVSELRLALGPGYRVYYTERNGIVTILLCGGDKGSQERDIARAKAMAQEIE